MPGTLDSLLAFVCTQARYRSSMANDDQAAAAFEAALPHWLSMLLLHVSRGDLFITWTVT